jgi:hypothetical protein
VLRHAAGAWLVVGIAAEVSTDEVVTYSDTGTTPSTVAPCRNVIVPPENHGPTGGVETTKAMNRLGTLGAA